VDYYNKLRDLRHFSSLAISCFNVYLNIWTGLSESEKSNRRKVFDIIVGILRDGHTLGSNLPILSNTPGLTTSRATGTRKSSVLTEMPFYSKYIMIAAYIASRNPVNSDQKFFVRLRGKRTRKASKPIAPVSSQVFSLCRLLAILSSLNREFRIPLGSAIRSQISSLCSVGLLSRVGDDLGDCKYKCLAGFELIELISLSVNFEIEKYLCH